jgi:asparagine synthase (glutamine-hydrolysing)
MCGIAGYILRDGSEKDPDILVRMTRKLRHRGPDDEGFAFIDTGTGQVLNC